ncbi:hypothetical protein C8Q78DRAFT_274263 [Trametes maxima]|nr:hypothetical protein C8Q78DRAFT_274263 [Trametes maxima]
MSSFPFDTLDSSLKRLQVRPPLIWCTMATRSAPLTASITPSVGYPSLLSLGILPSRNSSMGAIYIGLVIGSMLFGLTVHQTYRYFKLYQSDRLYIRILVVTIVAFDAFHSVLWFTVGYHYLVAEVFNIPELLIGHW